MVSGGRIILPFVLFYLTAIIITTCAFQSPTKKSKWIVHPITTQQQQQQKQYNHRMSVVTLENSKNGDSAESADTILFFAADKDNSSSSSLEKATPSSSFGESVPYIPLSQRSTDDSTVTTTTTNDDDDDDDAQKQLLQKRRLQNIIIALSSFTYAISHYIYQFTHPITAIQILTTMESNSAPLTAIGNNGKPTVIDFWAPWCSNCKVAAPTLQSIEEEYGDKVNFVSVNADDMARNGPLIQLFGVDSIPHLALLSGEGDVETALIGPMSRNVLRADIDVLLMNNEREDCNVKEEEVKVTVVEENKERICRDELPYKMYDAFANNRRESRRINFVADQ